MDRDKILLFSAGRTGSTLVYQCLAHVFDNVEKIHPKEMKESYENQLYDCVITVRDRVDAYLSFVRCVRCDGNDKAFREGLRDIDFLKRDLLVYKEQLDYVDHVIENYQGRKLVLDYSKFSESYGYIFKQFESFFRIFISEDQRKEIFDNTNRKSNIKIQNRFQSFTQSDPRSFIHGSHIWSDSDGYSKEILSRKDYKELEESLKP